MAGYFKKVTFKEYNKIILLYKVVKVVSVSDQEALLIIRKK